MSDLLQGLGLALMAFGIIGGIICVTIGGIMYLRGNLADDDIDWGAGA